MTAQEAVDIQRRHPGVAFWRNRDNRVRVVLRFYVFVAEGLSRVSLLCRSDYVSTFRLRRSPHEHEFEIVDDTHHALAQAAEWGFTYTQHASLLREFEKLVRRFGSAT